MIRLLKTPIIGPWPAMVASSWIDMLAGLSKKYTLRTPPDFCAHAEAASASTRANTITAPIPRLIGFLPGGMHRPNFFRSYLSDSVHCRANASALTRDAEAVPGNAAFDYSCVGNGPNFDGLIVLASRTEAFRSQGGRLSCSRSHTGDARQRTGWGGRTR